MRFLSRVKLLLGAAVIRAVEVYRLLFTRFFWIIPLLITLNLMFTDSLVQDISLLALLSVALLLSRSSMVRKDYSYVFASNQTVVAVLSNVTLIVGSWLLLYVQYAASIVNQSVLMTASFWSLILLLILAPMTLGFILLFFTFSNVTFALWCYFLLDSNFSWDPARVVSIVFKSLDQASYNIWNNSLLMIFFSLVNAVVNGIMHGIVIVFLVYFLGESNHHFIEFLVTMLVIPWRTALVAILYEEMRYRTGV